MAAVVVDHIIPHRGDFDFLFWESTSNWQPLCKSCHDEKTGSVDRPMTAREWRARRLALAGRLGKVVEDLARDGGWSKV